MNYEFDDLGLGVLHIRNDVHNDERGFFCEGYNMLEFAAGDIWNTFTQYNFSRSKAGTLRGLHFQRNYPQAKFLRVMRGEIFDVAVDIRTGSPTFGQHVEIHLGDDGSEAVFIPRGFAHGFLALKDSDVLYYVDNQYDPKGEGGILWSDPALGVKWPYQPTLMSHKDASWFTLDKTVL